MKKWWLFLIIPAGIFVILFVLFLVFFAIPSHNRPHYSVTYNATASITHYKNNLSLNWAEIPGISSMKANNLPVQGGSFANLARTEYILIPNNGTFYSASNITYCYSNGEPIKLDLYSNSPLSASDTNLRPIVIYVFGGGLTEGSKDQRSYDMGLMVSNLVNHGFVVAAIDYQLAPEHPYPAMTQDILCAIRFLKYYSYSFGGNQNKIGIFGNSVGGQLSSIVGVINGSESWQNSPSLIMADANISYAQYLKIPTRPQAVADFYGSADMPISQAQISLVKAVSAEGYQNLLQAYNLNLTLMSWDSAIDFVTYNESPFLIIQGEKDTLSDPSLAKAFYAELKSYNNDATLIMVANASHELLPSPAGSTISPSLENITNTLVNFFWNNLGSGNLPNSDATISAQEGSGRVIQT